MTSIAVLANCVVILIAHRGGLDHGYPENTLGTFRHAIERGAEAIELDLRGTKDGGIVVIHDESVDRTTNGRGKVAEMTLVELRELDAGRGERVPTYEEVLRLVSGTGVVLVLDIKENAPLDWQKVLRLTEEHEAIPRVVFGLRNVKALRAFRAQGGDVRTVGFVKEIEDIEPFVQAGVDIVRLWSNWIDEDPGLIDRVHRLGKPVWATAGDAPREDLERLIRLGTDGVITDRLELIRALRER